MPKLKTHSGTKKRFKLTAKGKVRARGAGRVHNLEHKSASRLRRARKGSILAPAFAKKVRRLLNK